jgi:hypothetical protein
MEPRTIHVPLALARSLAAGPLPPGLGVPEAVQRRDIRREERDTQRSDSASLVCPIAAGRIRPHHALRWSVKRFVDSGPDYSATRIGVFSMH